MRAQLARLPAAGDSSLRKALPGRALPVGLLRFEERLEVAGRSPERAIEDAFAGQDLRHGPTFGSAPSVAESRGPARFDANPESPTVDLLGAGLAGARALIEHLRGPGQPRYFLYEVLRADGHAHLLLREGRLPPQALEQPGVSYRELGGFAGLKAARQALARLESRQRAAAPPRPASALRTD